VKLLPIITVPNSSDDRKLWGEILEMCTNPRTTGQIKVVTIDNLSNPGRHIHSGVRGVVRKFNLVDYKNLFEDYNRYFDANLSAVYDFFPFERDKRRLTMGHEYLTRDDFEIIQVEQLELKLV